MQPATSKTKINYIDNLRVLLTVLVILHHTCITYGAPGSWYYSDKTTNETALIFMTFFVATNQAFFMGFFFFLSALFTETSYIKKGTAKFIADRLKRLGIPLLFYSFILSPVMNYLVYRFGYNKPASFTQYLSSYDDWIDPGVLWFVAALLILTLLFVLVKQIFTSEQNKHYELPSNNAILLFALLLGITSYVVRIIFPVGWVLNPLGFQLAYFPQYIALFIAGIIAFRNDWVSKISLKKGRRWLITAIILILLFPLLYVIKTLTNSPLDAFQGNGTYQSFLSATWEQLTGISIIVALLEICKQKWNYSTPLLKKMARAAYATYILHPLAVISIAIFLKSWQVDPAIKFLVAAPVAVTASFLLATLVIKLPLVKNIV